MRQLLVLCGLLSSLLYAGADIISAFSWEGYSFKSQAISELMAVNAPSRPVAAPLFLAYDLLVAAFGAGIVTYSIQKRLRTVGGLILGIAATGLITTIFFPMHLRGEEKTVSDTMHIVLTAVTTALITLAMASGAGIDGRRFRWFSILTLVIMLVFGALAGMDGKKLAEGQATPWLGVTERVTIGVYLLWMAVLSVLLHRSYTKTSN